MKRTLSQSLLALPALLHLALAFTLLWSSITIYYARGKTYYSDGIIGLLGLFGVCALFLSIAATNRKKKVSRSAKTGIIIGLAVGIAMAAYGIYFSHLIARDAFPFHAYYLFGSPVVVGIWNIASLIRK